MTSVDGIASRAVGGPLFLIGGAAGRDSDALWSEFARLARGRLGAVAVFPTAHPTPLDLERRLLPQLAELGLAPFFVPCAPRLDGVDFRRVAVDASWAARVRDADAVLLCGGDQARYRQALWDDADAETPLLEAIRAVHRRGGLVAGTSAGAAALGRRMLVDGGSWETLRHGARWGREVDSGFALLPDFVLVDQHFLARGRLGRLLAALVEHQFSLGVGVDENTAVVVEEGRRLRVVGEGGVLVVDSARADSQRLVTGFACRDMIVHYLSQGDRFDCERRTLQPAEHKVEVVCSSEPTPCDPDVETWRGERDLKLAPWAAPRVLQTLWDAAGDSCREPRRRTLSVSQVALSTPDDRSASPSEDSDPVEFEFRFRRGENAARWESPDARGRSFCVRDVRLDVAPRSSA